VIVNVTKSGAVLDYCEQGHPARLYPADDPTISHLRLTFAGSQAKASPDQGERGVNFDLRRFASPIRGEAENGEGLAPSERES
jgi:hypothetical protein